MKTSSWATIYDIYEDLLLLEGEETGRQHMQSADVACFASLDAMVAGAFITASSKAW